jgi:two-component system KDP operon response regulator KdpE
MTLQDILIVEDEKPMRKLLGNNLNRSGYTVHEAADGSEALHRLSQHTVDLVLLDIGLPGPNGLQVLEAIRRDQHMPVLILSARGRERDKVGALNMGADDYMTKPFGVTELLARIRALLRRTGEGPQLVPYRYQGLEVDFSSRRARMHSTEIRFTRREYEVLAHLARNAGKVLLHRQILQGVWGGQYGDESDYLWTFVRRIRRKLEPDAGRPRYVITEPGVGYSMPAAQQDHEELA